MVESKNGDDRTHDQANKQAIFREDSWAADSDKCAGHVRAGGAITQQDINYSLVDFLSH